MGVKDSASAIYQVEPDSGRAREDEVPRGYKRTEVGVIPEDWVVEQLGITTECLDNLRIPMNESQRERRRGDVPYCGANGVLDYVDDFVVDDDVILMAEDGGYFDEYETRPIAYRMVGKCWVNNHAHILKAKHKFSQGFIFYSLVHKNILNYLASGTRAKLNRSELDKIEIALPPAQVEQEAIAEVLGDADTLIESLQQLIAKKRAIKQGATQALLTGRQRLPGFTGEWQSKRLDDLFSFSGGFSASRDQLGAEGCCYLHYGDIHTSRKSFVDVCSGAANIPKLDIALNRVPRDSMLDDGDVVFVDASEDEEGTSKHIVVSNPEDTPFISGLHTIVAKATSDDLVHAYRRYCFQTDTVKAQFRFFAVGTKVLGVSKSNIGKIELRFPTREEQTAIAAVLSDMDAEIEVLETRLAKIRALKAGMMQALLTGRIRLVEPQAAHGAEKVASQASKGHSKAFNEAVVIAALAKQFGSKRFPLGRKRCTKLAYLLHRHATESMDDYLKKAAGPYNPKTRYGGAERLALEHGYVREHRHDQYVGFVAGDDAAKAEEYFLKWYGRDALQWLEQFRRRTNDELELLATADMAAGELRNAGKTVSVESVKMLIRNHSEWKAKLDRAIFSDANIAAAIDESRELFTPQG